MTTEMPPECDSEEAQQQSDKLEDLKDRLEQGTQERDQQQGDDGGGSGTDKPW